MRLLAMQHFKGSLIRPFDLRVDKKTLANVPNTTAYGNLLL